MQYVKVVLVVSQPLLLLLLNLQISRRNTGKTKQHMSSCIVFHDCGDSGVTAAACAAEPAAKTMSRNNGGAMQPMLNIS
jgi:hypothetical protein